jgi:hypothetical protein
MTGNVADYVAAPESAPMGSPRPTTPQKRGLSWGSLSGTLTPEIRSEVARRFREAGGDFGRWSRRDRELIVDALVRTEDHIELEHPGRRRDRDALRAVRRVLETELWP